jgi:MOSC domain-containing protein YiiM
VGLSKGKVLSISLSERRGTRKTNVESARIIKDLGLERDAHAGDWHRQVSLLPFESFRKLEHALLKVKPGDFAENITTLGIDLSAVEVGGSLRIGKSIVLEVTQIGKECHNACSIREITGDCIMPKEGIFAKVIEGGLIRTGDEIRYSRGALLTENG